MNEFLIENWQWIATTIGVIAAWFRREIKEYFINKTNAETSTIENLGKAVNVYSILVEDIKKQHAEQLESRDREIQDLKEKVKQLELRITLLERE